MTRPALEVEGLRKAFARDGRTVEVLDLERLTVLDGEFVTIVGPSGCGKTTLLHVLGGFVRPDAGRVRVHGRDVAGPGPDRGMVFQEFALFPWRTVAGNVGWGLEVRGASRTERATVVDRYLDLTGLGEFRDHLPGELSGGMKQRVALARVLAFDPEVLLMDEPFGSLDAQTRETMQDELTRIWEQTRKTIVFVTHDIEEAVYLGDRVVVLTARPARVREEVVIDLARPRDIAIRKSVSCLDWRNYVGDLIRSEARRTDQDGSRPARITLETGGHSPGGAES
jgi:NitT/TauT family transport system ATP-binding protein